MRLKRSAVPQAQSGLPRPGAKTAACVWGGLKMGPLECTEARDDLLQWFFNFWCRRFFFAETRYRVPSNEGP